MGVASKGMDIRELLPVAGPTKEFFIPATKGSNSANDGHHPGYLITASTHLAFMEFYVPLDFSTIIEVAVMRIAGATGTHRLNYFCDYGALGENKSIHNGSVLDVDTAEADWTIYEYDITALLASLAAGDYVGTKVLGDTVNVPNDLIVGIRFRYS